MQPPKLRKISHAVFSIHLHIVFVTKYRRKVLLDSMLDDLKEIFNRVLRQKYAEHLAQFYWGEKAKLWHDSKCIVSCGGAPLELVKQYIQGQSGGLEPKTKK